QKFKRLFSAHPAGKGEIENNTIKSLTSLKFLPIKLNTLQCGCGGANFIAKMSQGEFHQRADCLFVVDNEDTARSTEFFHSGVPYFLRHGDVGRGGQVNSESRTLIHLGFDGDKTLVMFDDGISGRQPKTIAFWFGSKI